MTFSPSYIHLAAPPFPYFLECDRTVYQPGDQHPNRNRMGKFDLIIVEQGTLFIGEDEKEWEVAAGHTLLLLPDRYHYAVKPCEEITTFVWIHFHTVGEWIEAGAIRCMPTGKHISSSFLHIRTRSVYRNLVRSRTPLSGAGRRSCSCS